MTTTDDRIREIDQLDEMWRRPARASGDDPPAPRRPRGWRTALGRQIDSRWSGGALVAWLVLFTTAVGIQPEPAQSAEVAPFLDVALSTAMLGLFVAAIAGLAVRRRWGMVASAAAAGLLLCLSLACPATGHHELAAWWYGQLACAGGLCAVSAAGLQRA